MPLSDASLIELVAELRERLRRFVPAPEDRAGTTSAATSGPGPLDPAGRASLAARLLGVVLGNGGQPEASTIAAAFDELAEVLLAVPPPLPGSALEEGLRRMAGEFEDLAMSWDVGGAVDLQHAWLSLRQLGDRLWLAPAPPAADPEAPALTAAAAPVPAHGRLLWLLVAGRLRRDMLRRRLVDAGFTVECLGDAEAVVARLADERPAAVICDDAAPPRHYSRLLRRLAAADPTVILVRGRPGRGPADTTDWLPPYRAADLSQHFAP